MVVNYYERKREKGREREKEGERDKKVKDTNKRQIDIKETSRGDDACRHGVPNSRARFPFQKIREKSERIEEARGMVIFWIPEMYRQGTYTCAYTVHGDARCTSEGGTGKKR